MTIPRSSPDTGAVRRPIVEVLEELSSTIEAVRGNRDVIRVSGLRGDAQDIGIVSIDSLQEVIRRACDELRAGVAQGRVPRVRTSHHRNKEEAARLQALVDQKYTESAQAPAPNIDLAEVLLTLEHARKFIVMREKMHPDGVKLYDETLAQVRRATLAFSSPASSTKRNTDAAPANRSTAKATANVGDNGERMGSEPAMGIVTGGSDSTPSMMSSTDSAAYATPGVHEIAREAYANGFADGKLAHNSPPALVSSKSRGGNDG